MRPNPRTDVLSAAVRLLAPALLLAAAACGEGAPFGATGPGPAAPPPPSASLLPAGVEPCGDVTEVDLLAGRDLPVGTVTVANDGDDLYVTFSTEGGWTLRETHLEVAASLDGVPTNGAGNPQVGRFDRQEAHEGSAGFTYTFSLSELGAEPDDELIVAAHAVVYREATDRTEGAWGDGTPFVERGSWAAHFTHTVQACVSLVLGSITSGGVHACALSDAGDAYCWGSNSKGQLGDGTTIDRHEPVAVKMPAGVTFTQLAAGTARTLALSSTGQAYAWGWNTSGILGDGTTTDRHEPVAVKMPPGVSFSALDTYFVHSLALSTTGQAYAWGGNSAGQLGDGTTTLRMTPVPVSMPSGVSFSEIRAGSLFTLALSTTGDAWAWGSNGAGQVGDGTRTVRHVPTAVRMPSGVSFTAIDAGAGHSLALSSGGVAYAWGSNIDGALGNGTTVLHTVPAPVDMPIRVDFTAISAWAFSNLAVASNGDAYAWGANPVGQLGDGTTIDRHEPVAVKMPTGVSFEDAAIAESFSLARSTAGDLYAWGWNRFGQLGDGTTIDRLTPVVVSTP